VSEETLALELKDGGDLFAALAGIGILILCIALSFFLISLRNKIVVKAGRTLDRVDREVGPLLQNLNTTVTGVNTNLAQVEGELQKVGSITENAAHVSSNVANITTMVTAAVGSPLVKVAALGFGLRSAVKRRSQEVDEEQVRRMVEASRQNKRERKAARKARKRAK
jgi:predicted PurR-regulated permease PerM